MKIAILSFYSGHMERGVENWTYQVASRLSNKHHQVTVYQNGPTRKDANYEIFSTTLKVNWKAKDSRGTLARLIFIDYWSLLILRQTLSIIPELFKKKYDIIIPTNGGWQPAFLRLLTWLRGVRMVIVGHSGKGWDDRNNVYAFPNVFVGLSMFARDWAKKINPIVESVYIPNGIDLEKFSPIGKKVKFDLERPVVLCVSAPERGKRLHLLIKAVSGLKKGSLLILGGGWQEKEIRKLGKEKLVNRFLIKEVSFNEIPSYYRSCDVFSLPSWPNEAFGMVFLEAMASGLPVVANDDPIRREIVEDAGILVDPTDTEAYAIALEKALNTNWGNKPRKQAGKFSWDKIVKKYEELFESLIK